MSAISDRPGADLLGKRVTIRLRDPEGGFRDIVGILESETTIRKRDGSLAQFAPEKIAIWREIIAPPEKAGRGAPLSLRIREIELAASAAWPAAEQVRMGDWLLRATGKLTFRANSVLPLGEPPYGNPGKPLQEAIDEVVAFYQERQLTPVFHIPLPTYVELDEALALQGWQKKVLVLVMVTDIKPPFDADESDGVWEVEDAPTDEWLSVQNDHGVKEIMKRAPGIYVGLRIDGDLVAVGRGANYEKWTTLNRLFVREDYRGRGLGRELVRRILQEAHSQGATKALLQVDTKNVVAIKLYQRLGFTEHHKYLYRTYQPKLQLSESC
ncbi:MAG: GNAT family N-acetyltransferase [Actinomycetota bacterium]